MNRADAKTGLRGSLVRSFVDTGRPITSEDVLHPRDRGFLASVLAPDTRAISIKVDAESGVSGLIWPGDNVDVVLTQVSDKADAGHRSLSEVVLHSVRIIAIDQDIVQGAKDNKDNNAAAGKETRSVSLQLAPEQVKTLAVAKELGKLAGHSGGGRSKDTTMPAPVRLRCVAGNRPPGRLPEGHGSPEHNGDCLRKRQAAGIHGQERGDSGCGARVGLRWTSGNCPHERSGFGRLQRRESQRVAVKVP